MSKDSILKQTQTFYLFTRPSFSEGMARVLDIGGTIQTYNESTPSNKADTEALSRDWKMVGKDIKDSISVYERKQSTNI
ncbi:MAG: hypothetical protein NTV62_02090 [Candidatus Gribaldobacteria bacterium]|nr:hypothetical protein [Candidatus Gribaldobacteria bacterium]